MTININQKGNNMATIRTHCEDCKRILGEPYQEIHQYLDAFASAYNPSEYGEYHRQFRHTEHEIERIHDDFGEKAAIAAKIHLIRDYIYYTHIIMPNVRYEDIEYAWKAVKPYLPKSV